MISKSALERHCEHIPAALVKAAAAEDVCAADSLLAQVDSMKDKSVWMVEKAQDIMQRAIDRGEDMEAVEALKSAVGPLREARGYLELLGEVTGELQRKQGGTVVNVGGRSTPYTREELLFLRSELDRQLGSGQ